MAKSPQYTIHISSHFALPLQLLCNTKTWDVSCAFNDISLVKVDEGSDTVLNYRRGKRRRRRILF